MPAAPLTPGALAYTFQAFVSVNPASIPAGSVQKESFACLGLRVGQHVSVNKLTDDDGIELLHARVLVNDELQLTFWNYTVAAVNPAAQTISVIAF